ncbi:reverse transcriptase [Gossypium australe]|uniref:Reverse transcriptase n=1 Tax=Gossypium australe TaxID=47621 RepID=A0A5B6VC18_9ROSI|nr:reverse transcriptase [Gossypium australe]
MVIIVETKIDEKRMEKIRRRCGFVIGIDVRVEGSRGGICLAWKEEITVSLKNFSKSHIDVMINEDSVNEEWEFMGFYGSPYVSNKSASWNLLRILGQEQNHPWLVSGDFNEIMYSFEKSGGQPREEKKMEAFREVLEECQLMDVALLATYTAEEVYSTLKGMGPIKAPDYDGFLALFFRGSGTFAKSAFVSGRLISDNVLLAYEILHTLRQKRTGKKRFMAVKLDMSKAYDRVEWGFLNKVMLWMGFAKECVALIMRCISTVSYAVNVNGRRGNVFKPNRGLHQGDPLSPFLFLICSEGFSSLIRLAKREGLLKGVKASRRGPEISYLLFADDCILFGDATNRGEMVLKEILKEYERSSGQCVNFNKSTIFYGSNTTEGDKEEILTLLGVRCSTNLEKYLGLPNMVGRWKKESFQNLKDRVNLRIERWSTRLLSQGGKEVFIKSVLQAIPTYVMSRFLLQKSLCGELENIFAKFWWQKGQRKKGIHWCQWKYMCCPKEEGMGFKNMFRFNISLLAKQGWRIINN